MHINLAQDFAILNICVVVFGSLQQYYGVFGDDRDPFSLDAFCISDVGFCTQFTTA